MPPLIAHLVEDEPGKFRIWAEETPPDQVDLTTYRPYAGPVAHVHGDHKWVYIITDDYEGVAMINIESLPSLIEALRRLEKHLQKTGND